MTGRFVDPLDRGLIALLQLDGRASFGQLGSEIGLSAEAARLRYLRLVDHGVLQVIGVVNPAHAGFRTVAGLGLSCSGHLDEVTAELHRRMDVTFLAWTRGDFSIIAELACADADALTRAVYDEISSLPGVGRVAVWDFLRVYKWDTGIRGLADNPLDHADRAPRRLDEVDIQLVRLLREDGRRPFSELADETGLPYGIVRRRCRSLLEDGFVHIAVVVDRVAVEDTVMGTIQLEIEGDIDSVLARLATVEGIEILFRTTGRYQGIGEVTGPSVAAVVGLVDGRIGMVPGVRSTALHLYSSIKKLPSQWRFEG